MLFGFFILSGLSVGAISYKHTSNTTPTALQSELEVTVRCNWGIFVTIENVGTETFHGTIISSIDIEVPSFYSISGYTTTYPNWTLDPGDTIRYRRRVMGLGPATISAELDYGQEVLSGNTTGYMFFIFVTGASPIEIP